MMPFDFKIPRTIGLLDLRVNMGDKVFVMGANGTGKSSLMEHFFSGIYVNAHQLNNVRQISAHRQTWFPYNTVDLSSQQKRNVENMRSGATNIYVPWNDEYANQHATISTYDLIDAENVRARLIAAAVDRQSIDVAKNLSKEDSPIKIINEILSLSNIPVEIFIGKNDQVVASKCGGTPYSIAKLSDGERNALLIAANVLTVKEGTLLLIDEPERHLHRSIISPLLTHLLSKREDCAFIISTHDVMLPLDNPDARTLLVRDCIYEEGSLKGWNIDIIPPETEIDNDIKKDILGARKKILFVEGKENSLDKPLYSLVFPNVSIIAKSNCRDVEHTVSSIRASDSLLWVQAVGIVDKDGRPDTDINRLREEGVYALSAFSVESIYYHPHIQGLIAQRQANLIGGEASTYLNNAKAAAIDAIKPEQIKHLSDRIAEKAVRKDFFSYVPKKADIQDKQPIKVDIDVATLVEKEYKRLENDLNAGNLAEIIFRYPIRETPALDKIAKALQFLSCKHYERAVLKLLRDDKDALKFVKDQFGDLISDLETA